MAARLSDIDIARVRAEHSIVDVLARFGIDPPTRWNGAADYMMSCPRPGHADSTPSCIVHPRTDRWHCFGCGAHADVLELVRQVEGVTSLSKIAEILDSRRLLRPVSRSDAVSARAITPRRDLSERPDLERTGYERVMAPNAEA
jgi:DNA primase